MPISMTATTRGFKKRYVVRDTRDEKRLSKSKNDGHAARCMAARIVFTVSVFGNCNSMCKYRVSTCNDPAYTCVRACVCIARIKYTLYRLTKTDSRAPFSILLVYYAQGLNRLHRFDIQLRHAVITCNDQTSRSRLVPVISRILPDNVPTKFTYRNLTLLSVLSFIITSINALTLSNLIFLVYIMVNCKTNIP